MKQTLVTHVRPHLDDLCGMWLIKKYFPGWRSARLQFVPATMSGKASRGRLMIGIGRGKFDEHKGDVGESATTLVWRAVRRQVKDARDRRALDALVDWVRDEDTGRHELTGEQEASPGTQLYHFYARHGKNSSRAAAFGFELLENMFVAYRNRSELDSAWRRRTAFQTPWGRGVGLKTDAGGADSYAYQRGAALVVIVKPKKGYRQYRASPASHVNLSRVYRELQSRDSRAEWFLHHSKKLLLSGSDVAPGSRTSRLSLRDLIRLLPDSRYKIHRYARRPRPHQRTS